MTTHAFKPSTSILSALPQNSAKRPAPSMDGLVRRSPVAQIPKHPTPSIHHSITFTKPAHTAPATQQQTSAPAFATHTLNPIHHHAKPKPQHTSHKPHIPKKIPKIHLQSSARGITPQTQTPKITRKTKMSDNFITPFDIFRGIRHVFQSIHADGWHGYLGIILLGGSYYALHHLTHFAFDDKALWLFALGLFYWNADARLPIRIALGCIILIPFLLWSSHSWFIYGEDWAEKIAVWTYFLLVIGVTKQILDLIREKNHVY